MEFKTRIKADSLYGLERHPFFKGMAERYDIDDSHALVEWRCDIDAREYGIKGISGMATKVVLHLRAYDNDRELDDIEEDIVFTGSQIEGSIELHNDELYANECWFLFEGHTMKVEVE